MSYNEVLFHIIFAHICHCTILALSRAPFGALFNQVRLTSSNTIVLSDKKKKQKKELVRGKYAYMCLLSLSHCLSVSLSLFLSFSLSLFLSLSLRVPKSGRGMRN